MGFTGGASLIAARRSPSAVTSRACAWFLDAMSSCSALMGLFIDFRTSVGGSISRSSTDTTRMPHSVICDSSWSRSFWREGVTSAQATAARPVPLPRPSRTRRTCEMPPVDVIRTHAYTAWDTRHALTKHRHTHISESPAAAAHVAAVGMEPARHGRG